MHPAETVRSNGALCVSGRNGFGEGECFDGKTLRKPLLKRGMRYPVFSELDAVACVCSLRS